MSRNDLESQSSQCRGEAPSTAPGSPTNTNVFTPPTSIFDSEETQMQLFTTDNQLHCRILQALESMTDLAQELNDSGQSVLRSAYISLGESQREAVSRFCLAVSDVHLELECDTTGFQDDDSVPFEVADGQSSSENALLVWSESTTAQSLAPESPRKSFQGGLTNILELSQPDTEVSEAESSQSRDSMQSSQNADMSQRASSITTSFAATARQRAGPRQIPGVDAVTVGTQFLVDTGKASKKPCYASGTSRSDRMITLTAAEEKSRGQKNTPEADTFNTVAIEEAVYSNTVAVEEAVGSNTVAIEEAVGSITVAIEEAVYSNTVAVEEAVLSEPLSHKKYENYCQMVDERAIHHFIEDVHDRLNVFATCADDQTLSQLSHGWHHETSICSDGGMLLELLDSTHGHSRFATIQYIFTAMHAAKWFNNKTSPPPYSPSASTSPLTSSKIYDLITGPKPEDVKQHPDWLKKRKRCSTHLARGRKWLQLVENFGRGVLFMDVWKLAKCDEPSIKDLILHLNQDPFKRLVLTVLDQQMEILLKSGRTKPGEFLPRLMKEAKDRNIELKIEPNSENQPQNQLQCFSTISTATTSLMGYIQTRFSNKSLLVVGTKPKLILSPELILSIDPDNSKRGGVRRGWIDSNIILVCMHLLYKLPGVKVGWSIEIHQQGNGKPIYKPFNRALSELKKWRKETARELNLISFFPLFQHNTHFSLLEINEGEKCLYHYDSLPTTADSDVKKACKLHFPEYTYVDADTLLQEDLHSCGPLVIYAAQKRMAGFRVRSERCGEGFATKMRETMLSLIRTALENGGLIPHDGRKRGTEMEHSEVETQAKKQKCGI